MVYGFAGIISLPLVGYLVDTIGPRYTIMLSVAFIIPEVILYLKIREELA